LIPVGVEQGESDGVAALESEIAALLRWMEAARRAEIPRRCGSPNRTSRRAGD
jgi:hypothetical protein